MTARKAAVLMAGLVVAAGLSAPVANARETCRQPGFKGVCQTQGTVSFKGGMQGTRPAPNNSQSVFPWLMAQGGF
jgi:hypothetical protein